MSIWENKQVKIASRILEERNLEGMRTLQDAKTFQKGQYSNQLPLIAQHEAKRRFWSEIVNESLLGNTWFESSFCHFPPYECG
jgi:hypothetical protein